MKKYSTGEMFEALKENPNLKFKCVNDKDGEIKDGIIVGADKNGYIIDVFDSDVVFHPLEVWELIQQPVSFMEAVKAYHEGKNVYCLSGPTRYDYMPHNESITGGYLFSCLSTGEMINGIWYIWED